MKALLLTLIISCFWATQDRLKTTIILINGEAHIVVLDDTANLVEVLRPVPFYFKSEMSHSEIVKGLIELRNNDNTFYANNEDRFVSKEEIDVLDNAEFIKFKTSKALLDRVAVTRIRQIADDYVNGGISEINLLIIYKDTNMSELLTDNRLNSVKDLLIAFGVPQSVIRLQKQLRNQYDDNPFVKVAYKKDVK